MAKSMQQECTAASAALVGGKIKDSDYNENNQPAPNGRQSLKNQGNNTSCVISTVCMLLNYFPCRVKIIFFHNFQIFIVSNQQKIANIIIIKCQTIGSQIRPKFCGAWGPTKIRASSETQIRVQIVCKGHKGSSNLQTYRWKVIYVL